MEIEPINWRLWGEFSCCEMIFKGCNDPASIVRARLSSHPEIGTYHRGFCWGGEHSVILSGGGIAISPKEDNGFFLKFRLDNFFFFNILV